MKVYKIKGVKVRVYHGLNDCTTEELERYVEYAKHNFKGSILALNLSSDDGKSVDGSVETFIPFERIRRITGYLTGDLSSWNDSKRAEERDRVKHDLDGVDDINPCH